MALSRASTSCWALARGLHLGKNTPVLHFACRHKSDLPPSSALSEAPFTTKATPHPKHPDIDLTFENARESYRSKTTGEIVRALLVFNLCSVNFLVDNQKQVNRLLISIRCVGRVVSFPVLLLIQYGPRTFSGGCSVSLPHHLRCCDGRFGLPTRFVLRIQIFTGK